MAEVARPLPKVPLQLRLEAAPDKPAVLPPKDEAPSQQMRPTSQPLPPISPSVGIRPKTDPGQRLGGDENLLISEMPAPGETAREKEELAENNNVEEPLFLTQVKIDGDLCSSYLIHLSNILISLIQLAAYHHGHQV